MNLSEARTFIAEGLTEELAGVEPVPGMPVVIHPKRSSAARFGTGWVVFQSMVPSGFGGVYTATFRVVVLLADDDAVAEELLDLLSIPLLDAIGEGLNATPLRIEPLSLYVDTAEFFALAATFILEVERN